MSGLIRFLKSLSLSELFKGLRVTGSYLFARKFTLQYPDDKTPISPRFRGLHALRRYPMVRSVALLVNCAKQFVQH